MPYNLYASLGVLHKFDAPHKFVTSPVIRSPYVFASIRLLFATYALFTLLFTLIWQSVIEKKGKSFFSYFTDLTYIGLCAYYFAAGVQTMAYALRWKKSGAGVGYPLQRWPRLFQALHVILQSSVITFPFIVTIVFWSLIAPLNTFSTPYLSWFSISLHILNSAFALFEVLLSNSPPAPWITLLFNILFMAGYIAIAYISRKTLGFYVYTFLDPQKERGILAAYILGIGIGEVITFAIVRGIVVLRERLAIRFRRVLDVGGSDSDIRTNLDGPSPTDDDEWEEIRRPPGSDEA